MTALTPMQMPWGGMVLTMRFYIRLEQNPLAGNNRISGGSMTWLVMSMNGVRTGIQQLIIMILPVGSILKDHLLTQGQAECCGEERFLDMLFLYDLQTGGLEMVLFFNRIWDSGLFYPLDSSSS